VRTFQILEIRGICDVSLVFCLWSVTDALCGAEENSDLARSAVYICLNPMCSRFAYLAGQAKSIPLY